jgi:hypothetical protein
MLSVAFFNCYSECRKAECVYTECRGTHYLLKKMPTVNITVQLTSGKGARCGQQIKAAEVFCKHLVFFVMKEMR